MFKIVRKEELVPSSVILHEIEAPRVARKASSMAPTGSFSSCGTKHSAHRRSRVSDGAIKALATW